MFRNLIAFLTILLLAAPVWAKPMTTGARCSQTGTCEMGDSRTDAIQLTTDGATLGLETVSSNVLTLTSTTTATPVFMGADAASPAHTTFDTTGAGAITIGSTDVTDINLNSNTGITFSDGGDSINNTADDIFDFTRDDAGIVTFTCSDDDAVAGCTYDAGGASPLVVGSADVTTIAITNNGALTVGAAATTDSISIESAGAITLEATGAINIGDASATSVPIITDGGTVTIDGYIQGQVNVVSLASGALTLNTVHLATAAADYDIPDSACDAAADVGNWVTVVMEDASTVISITSDDASNVIYVPGLDLGAGDELDSTSTASNEGSHITLTCLAAEGWYATSMSAISGGVIAWADGGTAD